MRLLGAAVAEWCGYAAAQHRRQGTQSVSACIATFAQAAHGSTGFAHAVASFVEAMCPLQPSSAAADVPVVFTTSCSASKACRAARQTREEAQQKLQCGAAAGDGADGSGSAARHQQQQHTSHSGLDVASQLGFTPISLVWKDLSYYVPAPKNASGAAAQGVVQKGDTKDDELVGKKQLLHGITGVLHSVYHCAPLTLRMPCMICFAIYFHTCCSEVEHVLMRAKAVNLQCIAASTAYSELRQIVVQAMRSRAY